MKWTDELYHEFVKELGDGVKELRRDMEFLDPTIACFDVAESVILHGSSRFGESYPKTGLAAFIRNEYGVNRKYETEFLACSISDHLKCNIFYSKHLHQTK